MVGMQDVHEKLLNAAQSEILSEKSLRYKRNGLVLGILIICGHLLPVRFDDLSLFGAKLAGNQALLAFILLWAAYIYNLAMFARFGRSDWQTWVDNLTGRWGSKDENELFFPELRMYWQQEPRDTWTISRRLKSDVDRFVEWDEYEADPNQVNVACYAKLKNLPRRPDVPAVTKKSLFTVPLLLVDTVQRTVNQAKIYELGIPLAILAFAALALLFNVGTWLLQPEGCTLICS